MAGRATVLASVSSVPPRPQLDTLKFSGISIVAYVGHRFDPQNLERAIASGHISGVSGPHSYDEKLRPEAEIFYSCQIPSEESMCGGLARTIGVDKIDLRQSIIWLGDDQVLSVFPMVLATNTEQIPFAIKLSRPITTQETLNFINELGAVANLAELAEKAELTLRRNGLVGDGGTVQSWPVRDSYGIMIWNLDGTVARDPQIPFRGAEESAAYAWELSALLSYSVDHMREPGLWLRQSPEQVYDVIKYGYCFLDDHMVFANSTCCLEVAHLPGWLRERSRWRLQSYGYDSSSLFVWHVSILRHLALQDIIRCYSEYLMDLSRRRELDSGEYDEFVATRLRHEEYILRLGGFGDFLRESRNRAFADVVDDHLRMANLVNVTERRLGRVRIVADRLAQSGAERKYKELSTGLAGVGIVLAAVGVPGMVDNFNNWITNGDLAPLIASLVLMLGILLGVPIALKRRK